MVLSFKCKYVLGSSSHIFLLQRNLETHVCDAAPTSSFSVYTANYISISPILLPHLAGTKPHVPMINQYEMRDGKDISAICKISLSFLR